MPALRIYAGPKARRHIEQQGLQPQDVGVVPGAAGGPKGLILGPLDRFIFGEWLAQSSQPVHLVGASIGAWRMATPALKTRGRVSSGSSATTSRRTTNWNPAARRPRPST